MPQRGTETYKPHGMYDTKNMNTASDNRRVGQRGSASSRRPAALALLLSQLLAQSTTIHSFLPSTGPRHSSVRRPSRTRNVNLREPRLGRLPNRICKGVAGMCSARASNAENRPSSWSNVGGKDLVQIEGNLYAAERPFLWNGIDVGGRMAIIKLSDGSLWVHSPVALDEPLRQALEKIGPVMHIVSPNYEHVKYAQQWMEAYPSARSYACPGLPDREPDVAFSRTVGNQPGDDAPPEWGGEIQACFIDCENNPFTGKPFFNEVVFFHRPTKALIASDLFWSYPLEVPLGTKVWKWGMDKVYLPFYKRFMVTDKGQFEAKVKKILDWGIESIVPCHGFVVRTGATQMLREQLLGK